MNCRLCGKHITEIKGFLKRVNEKGIEGIWECRPNCDSNINQEQSLLLALDDSESSEHIELKSSKVAENCPNCTSSNTSVDYGLLDDDSKLPKEVQDGKLPLFCFDCKSSFYGNWKDLT